MSTVLKAASISRALFEFDPMRTCCKENDCFDEYDRAAESVEERLEQKFTLKEALILGLADRFFDSESLRTDCLDPVVAYLNGSYQ